MLGGAPPNFPDPREVGEDQYDLNRRTALLQQRLGMTDQRGPRGGLSYRQVGTWEDGTPRYEADTKLDQMGEALQHSQDVLRLQTGANALNAAKSPVPSLNLGPGFDGSNDATESRLMELGRKRLDPMLADRRAARENQLVNQGVGPGTEAWKNAMGELGQDENDATNQLLLTGNQQAYSQGLSTRQQQVGEKQAEYGAGMAGRQQVFGEANQATSTPDITPQFQATPQAGVAPVDYGGMVGQKYQADYNDGKAKLDQMQALIGGIFGIGKTILGGGLGGGFLSAGATGAKPAVASNPFGASRSAVM